MTIDGTQESFNFDEWAALAKRNPEEFEAKRQALVEQFITASPPSMQQRLRSLQWRVDMERARAKNANSACVNIYRMMWNRVYGENGLLDALDGLLTATAGEGHNLAAKPAVGNTKSADVLQFKLGNN